MDTNVFIYHFAEDPDFGEAAGRILNRIQMGERTSTSTLVMSQVCAYMMRRKRQMAIPAFLGLLRSLPNLTKVETAFQDFLDAANLISRHHLEWKMWDDMVIAAQMNRMRIAEVYTNDDDFDNLPNFKRIFE